MGMRKLPVSVCFITCASFSNRRYRSAPLLHTRVSAGVPTQHARVRAPHPLFRHRSPAFSCAKWPAPRADVSGGQPTGELLHAEQRRLRRLDTVHHQGFDEGRPLVLLLELELQDGGRAKIILRSADGEFQLDGAIEYVAPKNSA